MTKTRRFRARTHRLINSRYPPIGVFENFGTPEEILIAMELEGATNDRLTRAHMIPEAEWAIGRGAGFAMAAFLHTSLTGGRFNGPDLGAWYCSTMLQTAIAETVYHAERRLRASDAPFPAQMQIRELISTPSAQLFDIRSERSRRKDLYGLEAYGSSQQFGEALRRKGADGLWYASVRDKGGENIVLYKPRLVIPVIQADHYQYDWDVSGKLRVSRLTNVA